METKNYETASSTKVKGGASRYSMDGKSRESPMSDDVGMTAPSTKRAKIGFGLGQVIGVVADVVVGAVKGGIAAGKNGIGTTGISPFNPEAEHKARYKEQENRPRCTYNMTDVQDGRAFPIWVGESRETECK